MREGYIILKFGNWRVLLLTRDGKSATMTRHVNGDWVTFDYSSCEVIGSVTVEDHDTEPTPAEILENTRLFQAECDAKITNAPLLAGAERFADGPADNVRYVGMTHSGTKYTP